MRKTLPSTRVERKYRFGKRKAAGPANQPVLSEAQIQKTCCEFLELDGWRIIRTDPVSDKLRGKGFGEIGMADILAIRYNYGRIPFEGKRWTEAQMRSLSAQVIWIEFKRVGGKPTCAQTDWISTERARGAPVWLMGTDFPATIEAFRAHYCASGLARKVLS